MNQPFRHKRLGYLSLGVTDIEESTSFLHNVIGLDLFNEDVLGNRYFRSGDYHHDLVLREVDVATFERSSWELEGAAELSKAYKHFQKIGLEPKWVNAQDCELLHIDRAFRVNDPVTRATWEYFVGMTVISAPRSNLLTNFKGGKHFGMLVPDAREATDYFLKQMGFALSDYYPEYELTLIRAWPNPNHHSLAFVTSNEAVSRFHHCAFMVEEFDDIGRLFNRAKNQNAKIQWGIGRHPTSGSMHLYIYGPDYFVWEYTFGMEQFPEVGAREARRMSKAAEDYDLWGAVPDNSHVHELPAITMAQEIST